MPELRKNPINGRWIIVVTEKSKGPEDFVMEKEHQEGPGSCPFCSGHEHMTPPEIDAHREEAGLPNTPGWSTRVFPNKYPALQVEGQLNKEGLGVFDMMNGVGAHEIIVETPLHDKELSQSMDHQVEKVIWAYRNRSLDLRADKRFKYILIFKNHGRSAGASLTHSHSQIIALPMIPKNVGEELNGAQTYFGFKERCVYCDMIRQELQDEERIISENDSFVAFAPFSSRFAFESWILPKKHCAEFCLIQSDTVIDLARILRQTLGRMRAILRSPSYNFIIHTSPIEEREREDYHWHIEIMPKLTRIAGFEWGSGFYINPTPPEVAAKFMREAKI